MRQLAAASLVLTAVLLTTACTDRSDQTSADAFPEGDTSYVFASPDAHFNLPKKLDEISGLALLGDGLLGAVQDEDGMLFVIDSRTGEVVEEHQFGKKGDYEAVDYAEGRLFILRSDGHVMRFDGGWSSLDEATTFDLDIPKRCDAEGLRYDAPERRLLVSCKDEPGPGLEVEKAIYAFDSDGQKLQDEPVFIVDSRRLNASLPDHPVNKAVRSVLSDKVDLSGFRPSELAIHPVTDELFILSSVRETILALNRNGEPSRLWVLPSDLLTQPEGMAFLPNGDLFIASEAGNQDEAVLLRFNYRPAQAGAAE